jgi:broad specificity phosphatase PhoE
MPRLVLVRHAEVVQNRDVPVERWPLSTEGVLAAAALRAHPALAGVSAVWSSPEPKALATARAIARDDEVRVHPGLRELDRTAVGWVGDHASYVALVTEILRRPDESVRGCERAHDAEARVASAVGEILAERPGDDVAVVSHGLVLTLYLSRLLGLPGPSLDLWRSIRFPDVAIVDAATWRVVSSFGRGP